MVIEELEAKYPKEVVALIIGKAITNTTNDPYGIGIRPSVSFSSSLSNRIALTDNLYFTIDKKLLGGNGKESNNVRGRLISEINRIESTKEYYDYEDNVMLIALMNYFSTGIAQHIIEDNCRDGFILSITNEYFVKLIKKLKELKGV